MAASDLYLGPIGNRQQGTAPPPREAPGVRQALLDAIKSLDEARAAITEALRAPVVDTCGVFIQRAGTQVGYARNNLLRARACVLAPPEVAPYLSYRRVPASEVVGGRRF